MTKTRPTPAKLPKARVMWAVKDPSGIELCASQEDAAFKVGIAEDGNEAMSCYPLVVIEPDSPAQARAICKAAPFLRMTEGEQRERFQGAINHWLKYYEFDEVDQLVDSLLRAMNLGGDK